MENNLFGVIIKVHDIDVCRSFYRDVLNLGDPVLDSNFWVEFKTASGFALALEKSSASFLEHESSATTWLCQVKNLEVIKERLKEHGFQVQIDSTMRMGEPLCRCLDPENNVFYIFEEPANLPENEKD